MVNKNCFLAPTYEIVWGKSSYTSYKHDDRHGRYVITVEQGTRFLLRFNITAWPTPTSVNLKKNGKDIKVDPDNGTIFLGLDRVGIQHVDRKSYAGVYTVSATNSEGTGKMSFELKVKRTLTNNITCAK